MQKPFDNVIEQITQYVISEHRFSDVAMTTAYHCFLDTMGCAIAALAYPECTKLLGPTVPGSVVPNGARVPGTHYVLDPITAAFNFGACLRWLDFNDTWLAAEWGHPSDNLGAILMVADYLTQTGHLVLIDDILRAMIKAHEIQGVLALNNSFNRVGLDHVILVKVASTAVVTHLLGGTDAQIRNALSNAWVDGHPLRTYRHAPNTGSRKSWAAGDACARAVQLAMMSLKDEMGYPSAITATTWGFQDVLFHGQPLQLTRPFGSYVMENVLFKIAFPAEFHAQTAVEAAIQLSGTIQNCIHDIQAIHITTHNAAMRIINKTGPLTNPADRDHCLQYMVAVALRFGDLKAEYYENEFATHPDIDRLREKMVVVESKAYSKDYLDPNKRAITNALQIEWQDGSKSESVCVEYPIGHPRRRGEGIPLLIDKFKRHVELHYSPAQSQSILALMLDHKMIGQQSATDVVSVFV